MAGELTVRAPRPDTAGVVYPHGRDVSPPASGERRPMGNEPDEDGRGTGG